jgi:hypothetical protein
MGMSSPISAAAPTNPSGAIGRCQVCGNMRQTTLVKFHRNIGMVVLRQTRSIQGNMCKTCVRSKFWDFTLKNLLLGPWGVISLIVTPIYLVMNIVEYAGASKKLSGALE